MRPHGAYQDFLETKVITTTAQGIDPDRKRLPSMLHAFQRDIVCWALRQGCAGIFTGTGTGKTRMQLAWAQQIPGHVLIVAPLAVTQQTIREAAVLGLAPVPYVRHADEIHAPISITNYDMLHHFVGAPIEGMILDEASIIKSFSGATRRLLIQEFTSMPYRLCCTATPAPNSSEEIGNYAEWLGVMTLNSMRATFFVHDEQEWRLMPHAREAFFRWMASWSVTMRGPEDLGYCMPDYQLPPLMTKTHFVQWQDTRQRHDRDGQIGLPGLQPLQGITDRTVVRRATLEARVAQIVHLVHNTAGSIVIWCGLNAESTALMAHLATANAVEISGSDSRDEKETRLLRFLAGEYRILVTKPSIAGFGVNMQIAQTAIFAGMNDSWESYYQAVRRLWRYGQQSPVTVHVVLSDHERPIWENVQRKEQQATMMIDRLIQESSMFQQVRPQIASEQPSFPLTTHTGHNWTLHHGDCVDGMQHIPDHSIGLIVYSPPFNNLFQYNASVRDMGNCRETQQFFAHHSYLAQQCLRVLQPGRLIAMHVMQVPAMLNRDGWIGLHDFRGQMIAHMQAHGFVYAGEVTCAKSPQAQAIRIRAKGLAFQQLHKDSAWSRPCLNDYILLFRAPGENSVPVVPDIDNNTWIAWASGIWLSTYYDTEDGYRETYTLNVAAGRDPDDTKHICPLPLDLTERCVRLWSNPGETVCDPFAGLGTTGVVALKHQRIFVGCELKDSYVAAALTNLRDTVEEITAPRLFPLSEEEETR